MHLLRVSTAGSINDGKSTLLGRLLYSSGRLPDDHIAQIECNDYIDLAALTDGLRQEREQGITVDVAYRYLSTPERKFIFIDTPGHEEFTRNMVTGASRADTALILVNAIDGVVHQTRRHLGIVSWLRLSHVVVCVNKMDQVAWNESAFDRIKKQIADLVAKLENPPPHTAIPISALHGDNVFERCTAYWWNGPTLMELLHKLQPRQAINQKSIRLPVQLVTKDKKSSLLRSYGTLLSGSVAKG